MSDRDFIIQEIRKLFKEQEENQYQHSAYNIEFKKITKGSTEYHYGVWTDKKTGQKHKTDALPGEFVDARQDIIQLVSRDWNALQDAALQAQQGTQQKSPAAPKVATVAPSTTVPTGPMPQDGKVMTAKAAKPTEGYTFQQIKVPAERKETYGEALTAGMDRGENGTCKSINNAALRILGRDPKTIYTALLNAGVIDSSYNIPEEPCDGLGELIVKFQERAINGLLRYQKNMRLTRKSAKDQLTYQPTVKTRDREAKISPELTQRMLREQQKFANVSVDGKIGSRTASLLKIYASEESFAKIAPKTTPKPATTSTSTPPKAVAKSTSTGTGKATGKKDKNCKIKPFINLDSLKANTILTLMGYGACDLEKYKEKGKRSIEYFESLGNTLLGAAGSEGLDVFLPRAQDRKEKIQKLISSSQGQIDIFKKITMQQSSEKEVSVPDKVYPKMNKFMAKAVSPAIFSLHAGLVWGQQIIDFAYIKSKGGNIPLIYLAGQGDLGALKSYLSVVNYNSWILLPSEKRRASFKKPINLGSFKGNLKMHSQRLMYFYKNALVATERKGTFSSGGETDILAKCQRMVIAYRRNIDNMVQDLSAFEQDPSEANFKKLIASGGIPSLTQKILNRQ